MKYVILPCLHSDLTLLSRVSICIWMRLYSLSACVDFRRYKNNMMKNIMIIHNAPVRAPAMASGENEYDDNTSYCKYPTLNLSFLPTRT